MLPTQFPWRRDKSKMSYYHQSIIKSLVCGDSLPRLDCLYLINLALGHAFLLTLLTTLCHF